MITKLLPNQISTSWPTIRELLYKNHPPSITINEQILANILEAALRNGLQVWVVHDSDLEENMSRIKSIVVTTILTEPLSKLRSLLIYGVITDYQAGDERIDYIKEMESIRKYAKANDCSSITAYSDVPAVWNIVKKLGGNINNRFLIMEV
jgi:hypothetical protein